MNVMAQAHKATKAKMARIAANGIKPAPYKVLFAIALRSAHKEYKAECETSPVEWYSVEGHVIDEENGKEIPVKEGSSKVETAADAVMYYVKNFKKHSLRVVAYLENGSVRVEKPNTNYK